MKAAHVAGSATSTGEVPQFQVMPSLSVEQLAALEADVAERGVVVPVVVDQHGRIIDGHHRSEIAARLGLPCPTEVRHVTDDEDARQTALALNLARRHVTREQRRDLITQECARPQASDREIARRLGCSPSTVAAVRRPGQVSNLDTTELSEDERRAMVDLTASIRADLDRLDDVLLRLPRLQAVRLLTDWWSELEGAHRGDEDFLGPLREHLYRSRLNYLLEVA